jgi:hypothetical protein
MISRSWGSSVSTVYDYRLEDRGSIPGRGKGFFPLASVSRPALRPTQRPIQLVLGSFPGCKARPGRDADRSLPSSVEWKNEYEI